MKKTFHSRDVWGMSCFFLPTFPFELFPLSRLLFYSFPRHRCERSVALLICECDTTIYSRMFVAVCNRCDGWFVFFLRTIFRWIVKSFGTLMLKMEMTNARDEDVPMTKGGTCLRAFRYHGLLPRIFISWQSSLYSIMLGVCAMEEPNPPEKGRFLSPLLLLLYS